MQVRESEQGDLEAIRALHLSVFDESEAAEVSQLSIDLLQDESALPILSLVAEEAGEIVGHVIFSAAAVDGVEQELSAYILAPLGVLEGHQGAGVGTALIQRGLALLERRGADLVFVYGDPNYYSRTGFRQQDAFSAPSKLSYPDAWQVQWLKPGLAADASGAVRCAASLAAPELW